MLFQYIGDGADAPAMCEIFDHFFIINGEPVEVTNPHAVKKLMGNKSFKFEPTMPNLKCLPYSETIVIPEKKLPVEECVPASDDDPNSFDVVIVQEKPEIKGHVKPNKRSRK